MKSIEPTELLHLIDRHDAPLILDVRSQAEFTAGHVPGAVGIPFTELASHVRGIGPRSSSGLVVYCGHGPRAWIAAAILRLRGLRRVRFLRGHWAAWQRARLRVER